MNSIYTKNQAMPILLPLIPQLVTSFTESLDDFQLLMSNFPGVAYKRTKATIFNNIISVKAKAALSGFENVTIFDNYESPTYLVSEVLAARVKKLNKDGQPVNHSSRRNKNIVAQQTALLFPDYPPITHLDFGYKINSTWTEYLEISVSCNLNKLPLWSIDLNSGESNIRSFDTLPDIAPVTGAKGNLRLIINK